MLDHDGVFRHYVHPKSSAIAGGVAEWAIIDFKPDDICKKLLTSLGSGACGHNSYCAYETKQMVTCQCPVGYSWIDLNRAYMGCKPNFTMPSCISGVPSEGFHMVRVEKLDFWGQDYDQFNPMDEADCMQHCLDDCFCAALIHDDNNSCWKKKLPFSNGRNGSYVNRIALIKIGNDDNLLSVPFTKKRTWILPSSLALGGLVVLNFIILSLTIMFLRASRRKQRQKLKGLFGNGFNLSVVGFSKSSKSGFNKSCGI